MVFQPGLHDDLMEQAERGRDTTSLVERVKARCEK